MLKTAYILNERMRFEAKKSYIFHEVMLPPLRAAEILISLQLQELWRFNSFGSVTLALLPLHHKR